MATSPFPQWAQEAQASGPRPTADQVLLLALVVVVAVAVWIALADHGARLAAEHRRDQRQACADLRRLEGMGVVSGTNHAVLVRRCHPTTGR